MRSHLPAGGALFECGLEQQPCPSGVFETRSREHGVGEDGRSVIAQESNDAARAPLPLRDPSGAPLVYSMSDEALELLHFIDQHASGEIRMPEVVVETEAAKKHYLVNSLSEEVIRSSQLEGATTSHVVAKEMILQS
jgi:hypothetical protein